MPSYRELMVNKKNVCLVGKQKLVVLQVCFTRTKSHQFGFIIFYCLREKLIFNQEVFYIGL